MSGRRARRDWCRWGSPLQDLVSPQDFAWIQVEAGLEASAEGHPLKDCASRRVVTVLELVVCQSLFRLALK